MKEYDLNQLLSNPEILDGKIKELLENNILKKQPLDIEEIKGHILKAEHNLRFVLENIRLGFFDWAITGCYYACYHSALGLILTKGYSSKSHLATLCIMIKEFYRNGLEKDDFEAFSDFIDYQDILFYVETKNKREDATYSTKSRFGQKDAEQLRIKAVLLTSKLKNMLKNYIEG